MRDYVLKKDNPFYGKKGKRISKNIYDRLPEKHKEYFKYDSEIERLTESVKKGREILYGVVPF